jgi:hypothetical protein
MISSIKKTVLFVILLLATQFARAQWEQIDYNGGTVKKVIELNQILFTQTYGGIYKSVDTGFTWSIVNNEQLLALLKVPNFTALNSNTDLFSHNGKIYFSCKKYLLESADEGKSWSIDTIPTQSNFIYYFNLNNTLLAFTGDGENEIFQFTSGTWVLINQNPTFISLFQADNNSIYYYNRYVPKQSLYKSYNGINFQEHTLQGIPKNDSTYTIHGYYYYYKLDNFTGINNHLFVVVNDSTLYGSESGSIWSKRNTGLPAGISQINSVTINENKVYLRLSSTQSDDEIYVSDNYGQTWTKSDLIAYAPKIRLGNKIIRASTNGIFVSEDDGLTWKNTNAGLRSTYIYFTNSYRNKLFAFDYNRSVLIYSVDNGLTWIDVKGLPQRISIIKPQFVISANRSFILTTEGVYTSFDEGETWSIFNYPKQLNYVNWIELNEDGSAFFQTTDTLYKRQFYRTYDYVHFENITSSFPISADLINTNFIYKGEWFTFSYVNSQVFKSDNNGKTWKLEMVGLPTSKQFKFEGFREIDGQLVLCMHYLNYTVPPRMYVYNGVQWVRKSCNGIYKELISLDLSFSDGVLYTADYFSKKVLYSSDFGDNWYLIDTLGLSNTVSITVDALTVNNAGIYIGTHNAGLWKHPLMKKHTGTGLEKIDTEVFIYPNPASSDIHVLLSDEIAANTIISLYNNLGQLIRKEKMNTNNHLLSLQELNPGIYMISVSSGNKIGTKIFVKN